MTPTDIAVRRATSRDLDALVAFQQSMAQETESKALDTGLVREGVAEVFRSADKGFYLVAEAQGNVVAGMLITYEWSDWRNATFWWIQSVYVEPQWRRKGVYRAMHDHVFDTARARDDICGIRLYVERTNQGAQRTYQSLGMAASHYDMYEVDFVL